jgi:hypothetical protein
MTHLLPIVIQKSLGFNTDTHRDKGSTDEKYLKYSEIMVSSYSFPTTQRTFSQKIWWFSPCPPGQNMQPALLRHTHLGET